MKPAVTLFISILFVLLLPLNGLAQSGRERASFQWNHLPLRTSLDSLMKWYSESIVYLDADVEGKEVFASCSNCGFDQAMNSILNGTSLVWIRRGSQIIIKEEDVSESRSFATLSGRISDSLTGEWIAGASVILQNISDNIVLPRTRWCPTNSFGFYSFPQIKPGRYLLTVRALGYEVQSSSVDSLSNEAVSKTIALKPKDIVLNAVTVEGQWAALGSAERFSRSVYRPSVPSDQNQYLLDGGRIYNPAHFGGVLSTFSPEFDSNALRLVQP